MTEPSAPSERAAAAPPGLAPPSPPERQAPEAAAAPSARSADGAPAAASERSPAKGATENPARGGDGSTPTATGEGGEGAAPKRRRRGSRGGRGRPRPGEAATGGSTGESAGAGTGAAEVLAAAAPPPRPRPEGADPPPAEARGVEAGPGEARREPARGPKVGDTRPAPPTQGPVSAGPRRPRIGDTRPPTGAPRPGSTPRAAKAATKPDRGEGEGEGEGAKRRRRRKPGAAGGTSPATAVVGGLGADEAAAEVSAEAVERRRGRERNGRPVGRYLMVVHTQPQATQIAGLEGRTRIRHVVSRPHNDTTEIDGNIYLARVQNVLPGMEAAFVDIGTPKNAVLYRGDVRFDAEDVERGKTKKDDLRIEQVLKAGQVIVCQVTKNPIAHKGARLTQDVSLPGRFVVLVPNSDTYGISKRLPDDERKRLRRILDGIRPPGHGIIVRTAAEGCSDDELRRDVARLVAQWEQIDGLAKGARAPSLLYREPDIAVRFIREELNKEFRSVVLDDPALHAEVLSYVSSINPEMADRVELHDPTNDPLPLFERHHVHEQLHKAVDRKVWLPSGGSIIIERTEALTVIDVNTGRNVGKTNLEETVFRNNLEAADEIARQLRLRDIGGIIVIDFIDMEVKENREQVGKRFRQALSRDKTRVQVFDISELGLIEMTRKRVSEGLVESLSETCPVCSGRGFTLTADLLE